VPGSCARARTMRAPDGAPAARQTEGYLPAASVAFIDEVFKANSAILNTLLTILNERLFDNGADRVRVPLICLVRCGRPPPARHSWLHARSRAPPVCSACGGARG